MFTTKFNTPDFFIFWYFVFLILCKIVINLLASSKYLHFLADQWTFFPSGEGRLCPVHYYWALAPPIFSTFRRSKDIKEKNIEFTHKLHMTYNFYHLFFTLERKSVWIEQFHEINFMECLKGENNQHFQFLCSMMLWITVRAQCTSISNFWLDCYVN